MKRKQLLLLLALLMTAATGAWGKQIYISYPAWPSGTTVNGDGNLVLEVELSDSFENLKAKINDKSGLNPTYMHLYYNSSECANTEILDQKGITEGSVLTLVYIPPYAVKLKDGTADAGNWTATVGTSTTAKPLPVGGLSKGNAVTLTYGGRLKVKSVTATHDGWDGDLSNIPASLIQADGTVIVPDGTTLTGTLNGSSQPYKITIAADATVTLDGVTINGVSNVSYKWAGLNCLGNATIVLKDGTTNTVRGFWMIYPGIHVPEGSTLTITGGTEGTGKLTASPFDGGTDDSSGAGIGGGFTTSCGDIDIQGGVITATGGAFSAGIGGGCNQPCGNISIEGGTVTATGGPGAAGIGGGLNASCGNITIASTVTRVTATKGDAASHSIGAGNSGTCGTVTIGGTVYWHDNAAVGDGATYLAQATIVYPDPLATPLTIEAISAGTIVVGMNGTLSTGMKYSVNGDTPRLIIKTTPIVGLKAGDKVQFYGNGTSTQTYGNDPVVTILGIGDGFQTKVYGNIMSLLDEEGFATLTDLPNATFVFRGLFRGNVTLIDASELLLPAATLTYACYQRMFEGCTNLTTAPKLPATTLAQGCYAYMFRNCQLLTAAPKLPATELVFGCYQQMFIGCTGLTNAYVKAAYIEGSGECLSMFDGCTATDAVLHTTSGNKASWQAKMGTGKIWSNWSVADDWQD